MDIMRESIDRDIELEYKLFMQNKEENINYEINMGFGEVMTPLPKYKKKHYDNFNMSDLTSEQNSAISELPKIRVPQPIAKEAVVIPLVAPVGKPLGVKLEKTQDKIVVDKAQVPLNDTLNHLITSMTLDQDMFQISFPEVTQINCSHVAII